MFIGILLISLTPTNPISAAEFSFLHDLITILSGCFQLDTTTNALRQEGAKMVKKQDYYWRHCPRNQRRKYAFKFTNPVFLITPTCLSAFSSSFSHQPIPFPLQNFRFCPTSLPFLAVTSGWIPQQMLSDRKAQNWLRNRITMDRRLD